MVCILLVLAVGLWRWWSNDPVASHYKTLPVERGPITSLVTATGGHFASVVSFERLRAINPWVAASSRSFCVMQPVDELVAQLNRFQPTVLATYPTAAALLADEVLPALPPRQWVISSATGAVTLVQRFGSASSCSSTRSFTSTSSRPPRQGAGTRRTRLAGA